VLIVHVLSRLVLLVTVVMGRAVLLDVVGLSVLFSQ
jgi:hypothetical protein